MYKRLNGALILFIFLIILAGCNNGNGSMIDGGKSELLEKGKTGSGQVVIYSSRKEQYVMPLIEKFEQETGIRVKLLSEAKVAQLLEEKNNPQADLFLSNDIGQLEFLRLEGVLEANDSKKLEIIDYKYRAEDGSWVGLSARSRILMYNTDLISEEEMPKTLWELTDPKWKGQFMITRGGNESFISHVAALRTVWGDEKTVEWIKKVKENSGAIVNGHGDIRKSVGAGEYKFGLVNNYYYHTQLAEPTDNHVAAIYPDQGESGLGVFVNATGIGLIKGGSNHENAKQFIDWLLEPEQQKEYSYNSKETPLLDEIQTIEDAKRISDYKVMEMPLYQIGPVWADAKRLIEEAGLDLELK